MFCFEVHLSSRIAGLAALLEVLLIGIYLGWRSTYPDLSSFLGLFWFCAGTCIREPRTQRSAPRNSKESLEGVYALLVSGYLGLKTMRVSKSYGSGPSWRSLQRPGVKTLLRSYQFIGVIQGLYKHGEDVSEDFPCCYGVPTGGFDLDNRPYVIICIYMYIHTYIIVHRGSISRAPKAKVDRQPCSSNAQELRRANPSIVMFCISYLADQKGSETKSSPSGSDFKQAFQHPWSGQGLSMNKRKTEEEFPQPCQSINTLCS